MNIKAENLWMNFTLIRNIIMILQYLFCVAHSFYTCNLKLENDAVNLTSSIEEEFFNNIKKCIPCI